MSLSIQQASYYHTDKELLFNNVSFSLEKKQKAGLVGNNGTGKSTLLRIIRGELRLASGHIVCADTPYYVPQHFGQYNDLTIAQALCIEKSWRLWKR